MSHDRPQSSSQRPTEPSIPPRPTRKVQEIPKVLAGFRLTSKLGKGGTNTVFRALQVAMDREVALKVLPPKKARDQTLRRRYVSEAQLAGRIHHTNLITCYDLGEDKGWMYMALELVDGGDLRALLKVRGGSLPERLALGLARDLGRGLEALGRSGVIHRDIKPANIFLTKDMVPKLADFGTAVPAAAALQRQRWEEEPGLIAGTPNYMAPEQARADKHIDARADLHALGATLFRMVCGRPPYNGSDARTTLKQVRERAVPDPKRINPKLTEATREIILTAMAKDPDDRYPTAAQMVGAIELALQGDGLPMATPLTPDQLETAHISRRLDVQLDADPDESGYDLEPDDSGQPSVLGDF